MTEASRVLVALRVPASAERAFATFTEQIAEWWQPNGLFQFTDRETGTLAFEPGPEGRLVETYADGSSFVIGHIRVWEPPHRLVLSWRHASFAPGQETELHVRFDPVDDAGPEPASPSSTLAGTRSRTSTPPATASHWRRSNSASRNGGSACSTPSTARCRATEGPLTLR